MSRNNANNDYPSDNDDANYQDCTDNDNGSDSNNNVNDEASLNSTTNLSASMKKMVASTSSRSSNVVSPNNRMSPRFTVGGVSSGARRSPLTPTPKQRFPGNGLGSMNYTDANSTGAAAVMLHQRTASGGGSASAAIGSLPPINVTTTAGGVSGVNNNAVVLHLAKSKYRIMRRIAKLCKFNVIEVDENLEGDDDFNILWGDTMIPLERLKKFQPWQHFNHFASMYNITRKHNLSLTMGKMQRGLPQYFKFVPRSWSLKTEREIFAAHYESINGSGGRSVSAASSSASTACLQKDNAAAANGSSASPAPTTEEDDGRQVFIMKPNSGCQGKGIVLTKDPLNEVETPEDYVVQEYIARPLLIDGRKFDLRVYCLVSSMKHPSIMVFNEGLVRLCAESYEEPNTANMGDICKHLTNYAVNKKSTAYQAATSQGDNGSKRNFAWFNAWLDKNFDVSNLEAYKKRNNNNSNQQQNHNTNNNDSFVVEGRDAEHSNASSAGAHSAASSSASAAAPTPSAIMWADIDDIIIKTVLSAQPKVRHAYNTLFPQASNDGYTCFEVLGFDILIDDKLRPWLMEVNHTPSFVTATSMDLQVKGTLLKEVMTIINPSAKDRMRHILRMKSHNDKLRKQQQQQNNNNNNNGGNVSGPNTPRSNSGGVWKRGGATTADDSSSAASGGGVPPMFGVEGADNAIYPPEYHQLHLLAEDSRMVNFRRVYPVPSARPTASVGDDNDDSVSGTGDHHLSGDDSSTPAVNPYAIGAVNHSKRSRSSKQGPTTVTTSTGATVNLPVEFQKDNHIPPCHSSMDINDRIAASYTPEIRDMQRVVYADILNYASYANAAKRDPLRYRYADAAANSTLVHNNNNNGNGNNSCESAQADGVPSEAPQVREEAFYPAAN